MICFVAILFLHVSVTKTGEEPVLTLLNVLPFPDGRSSAGFDGGHELVPAANLAVEQINNRSDLLAGYTLEAVAVDSEPCGVSVINNGLVNTYAGLVDSGRLVVGVVGLFCAGVTDVVSSLATLPLFDRLQISGSTSSKHRDTVKFPRLYHTVSSSALYAEAVIKLMFEFGWERIGLVHDSNGVEFQTTAEDFAKLVTNISNFELAATVTIVGSLPQVSESLIRERAKVVFLPVTASLAAGILCQAFMNNAVWPHFVYIFSDQSVNAILKSETSCSHGEMITGIEGVLLLNIRTEADPNTVLFSGLKYEEYWNEYFRQLELQQDMTLDTQNTLANVAHDQIWAFSLALNNSLDLLHSVNRTIEDYPSTPTLISDIIEEQLRSVRFQGAAGYFELNDNQETASSLSISQVQNGAPMLVGLFDPQQSDSIMFFANISVIPDDKFEEVFAFLPLSVVIPMSLLVFFGFGFTTFILLLFVFFRNRPEIKASSQRLSIILFVACYMILGSSCTQIIIGTIGSGIGVVCNIDLWLVVLGINLINGTIFVRLLRVYYVFKVFGKTGRFWSDHYLILAILALTVFDVILLVIASIIDPLRVVRIETFLSSANPPFIEVTAVCDSEYFHYWVLMGLSYNGAILFASVVLAFRTRHIKRTDFKDTKKIVAYIYVSVFIFLFGVVVSFVLRVQFVSLHAAGTVAITSGFLIAFACQAFILAPKVIPLLFNSKSNLSNTHSRTQSQFSLIESLEQVSFTSNWIRKMFPQRKTQNTVNSQH